MQPGEVVPRGRTKRELDKNNLKENTSNEKRDEEVQTDNLVGRLMAGKCWSDGTGEYKSG